MADVKWIKIMTNVFDDEKILLIESMPDADAIIVIWFKLLCMAGKQNNNGVFMMSDRIAYTEKMLATIFRRKESTVSLALKTFEEFGMIEVIDGVITIPNWDKHQSADELERMREQTKKRVARHRERQRLMVTSSDDVTLRNVTDNPDVTLRNGTDKIIDKIKDKKIKEDINNIYISDSDESDPPAPKKKKPVKHKYGEYNNVLLADEELEKLKLEYPDYLERIERLSSYVASTGKSYKSHYATIRNWARKDANTGAASRPQPARQTKADELDDFYRMASQWGESGGQQ